MAKFKEYDRFEFKLTFPETDGRGVPYTYAHKGLVYPTTVTRKNPDADPAGMAIRNVLKRENAFHHVKDLSPEWDGGNVKIELVEYQRHTEHGKWIYNPDENEFVYMNRDGDWLAISEDGMEVFYPHGVKWIPKGKDFMIKELEKHYMKEMVRELHNTFGYHQLESKGEWEFDNPDLEEFAPQEVVENFFKRHKIKRGASVGYMYDDLGELLKHQFTVMPNRQRYAVYQSMLEKEGRKQREREETEKNLKDYKRSLKQEGKELELDFRGFMHVPWKAIEKPEIKEQKQKELFPEIEGTRKRIKRVRGRRAKPSDAHGQGQLYW
jgi:hypothetical protein